MATRRVCHKHLWVSLLFSSSIVYSTRIIQLFVFSTFPCNLLMVRFLFFFVCCLFSFFFFFFSFLLMFFCFPRFLSFFLLFSRNFLIVAFLTSFICVNENRKIIPDQKFWPSGNDLFTEHLNINHVFDKITDVTTIICNSGKLLHLFGFSESRLTDNMPSSDLLIPDYTIVRRDAKTNCETGLLIYFSDTISCKHLFHLYQPGVEAIWIEITCSIIKSTPILDGFCYRYPASRVGWLDVFTMVDRFSFESKEIILLGDFNINLKKAHPQCKNSFDSYNLHQLVN